MRLHELQPLPKRRGKKRIGRGGKRGTYSGRGQKGQKARAGHRIRPAERDTLLKIPKLRGVKNPSRASRPFVINVGDLERYFKGDVISKESFLEKGLIRKMTDGVKVLGGGAVKNPFVIEGIKVSAQAKAKIEKAHGKIRA